LDGTSQILIPIDYEYGFLLLASAYTPVHAGSGRGYGVVDQPIQRDTLGYPEIWSSTIKGSIKSLLMRRITDKESVKGFLGSEPGEDPTIPGLALLTELTPIAIPIPSSQYGFLYITTPYLLTKLKNYIELLKHTNPLESSTNTPELSILKLKNIEDVINNIFNNIIKNLPNGLDIDQVIASENIRENEIYILTTRFKVIKKFDPGDIDDKIVKLNTLYSYKGVFKNLVVISDKIGKTIVNSALQIVYRNRLDRATKTVERGALWSEEYLPYGTLFAGLLLIKNAEVINKMIDDKKGFEKQKQAYNRAWKSKNEILKGFNSYVAVGGRETIGKGILKLVLAHIKTP